MRRAIDLILMIAVLGGAAYFGYVHRDQVVQISRQITATFVPCQNPISYSIGSVDARFGISKSILIADLKEAEAIWEKPSGKDLFVYETSGGDVTVNLVYDKRQAATDKLKVAGIQIDSSQASYDALKAKYDSLSSTVEAEQAQYEHTVAAYKNHEAAYNARVEYWNQRGGAPASEYKQLQQEKAALQQELENVNAEQARMNTNIDTLNALATTLNQLIVQLNLNVNQYNQVGASQGEFEEGLYESSAGSQKIDIYEYSSHNVLVRVLAHEMGHALGLEHVADVGAIMYKINQGKNLALTKADVAELNARCTSGIF